VAGNAESKKSSVQNDSMLPQRELLNLGKLSSGKFTDISAFAI
jgi:hypothetical protein